GENLSISPEKAVALRADLLARCRRERWITHHLRREIDLKLGKSSQTVPKVETKETDFALDSYQLSGPTEIAQSLFSEQITLMIDLLGEIDREKLEESELDRLLEKIDDVLLALQKIRRRQSRGRGSEIRGWRSWVGRMMRFQSSKNLLKYSCCVRTSKA